jgi:hypothetical protein
LDLALSNEPFDLDERVPTMWFDSSCEECLCSTRRDALDFAHSLVNDYQNRISYLSITQPDGAVEVVTDRRSHLDNAAPSSMVSRST